MITLFFIGTLWLAYVYVGYPILLATLALVRPLRPTLQDIPLPTVSVLIAARNEERDIGRTLTQMLASDYPRDRFDILVASDASTDRTDDTVRAIGDPRVTLLRIQPRAGKTGALNHLALRARGDLLFFTDANSHIPADCLHRVARHFADPRVGCVTGHIQEISDSIVGDGALAYWGYESFVKRLESAIGSVLACVGSVFCIRRELYTPLQPDLANDLELPLRILHAGYWVRYEPLARSVEKATRCPWQEFSRRRRICAQGLLAMWRLRHTLRGFRGWQFFSRKFLRWLTLVPVFLILLSSAGLSYRPSFAFLLTLHGLFFLLAAIGLLSALRDRHLGVIASLPFYFLLVNAAALVGLFDACLGKRFATWDIASLSRHSPSHSP